MKVFDELREKLKGLELEEEKVNDLLEFAKKEIPKEFIPKEKYNEKVSELDAATSKLEETNNTIEELKSNTGDIDEYKTKLDQLNQEYNEYKNEAEQRVQTMKKKNVIKDNLINSGADPNNVDLLMYEFENKLNDMKLNDDGSIIGLDEYINPLKEKRAPLFSKQQLDGAGTEPSNKQAEPTVDDTVMREAMGLPVDK
jgi:chromosome segregation ATPase